MRLRKGKKERKMMLNTFYYLVSSIAPEYCKIPQLTNSRIQNTQKDFGSKMKFFCVHCSLFICRNNSRLQSLTEPELKLKQRTQQYTK